MPLTVDEYVKINVLPQYQAVVKAIRDLMRECAPQAQEAIAYGIPVWKVRKIFAVISPNKQGITFSFSHGAEFEDKYGLLKGAGKTSKHVKIKNVQAISTHDAALRDYIRQALAIDAK